MVGRGTLIVILGFSLIFAVSSQYWNRNRVAATENLLQYYDATVARNIAESASNLGADSLFWDFNTTDLNLTGSLSGGTYSTTTALISGPDSNVTLTAVGSYQGLDDSVIILLRRYYFSMFAVNVQTMSGAAWATGDTIQGPLHVEGDLNTSGSPVFEGEVTIAGKLNASPVYSPGPPPSGPIFEDNLLTGISVPIPTTSAAAVLSAAQNGGIVFNNPTPGTAYNVYLTFNSDGTVSYKTPGMSADTTVSLTTLAPNGVIMVDNGILHLQGTVNGNATVGAYSTSSSWGGPGVHRRQHTLQLKPHNQPKQYRYVGHSGVLQRICKSSIGYSDAK
ncbi:MAG TPA: hypothetical protein PL001_03450 [Candidatus Kryptobacter bacterium]|nr:hypothetical protein [Candidatus Kryptobacter bacterium]